MILHAMILFVRHFSRRKLVSLVITLSVGMAISISMLLYAFIQHERRTDRFHTKSESVYRLLSNDPFDDKLKTLSFIRTDASEYISSNYPEIKRVCKITDLSGNGVTVHNESNAYENVMVLAVDATFYDMFDYPFLKAVKNIGNDRSGIVITEKLALKVFGQTDVLGHDLTVHYDTLKMVFTVTGVMGTVSENTHLRFDALVLFDAFDKYLAASTTYLELHGQTLRRDVEAKISADRKMPSLVGPGGCDYFLQPLADVYFDKGNVKNFTTARSAVFIKVLWLIMFLILFIGTFNFLNLFIISLVDRRKEFGVRKVQGATAVDIRGSVTLEAFAYVVMGLVVSLVLSILCLSVVNQIFQTDIAIGYLFTPVVMCAVAFLSFGLILIVPLVLTFYLNKIQSVSLLSGKSMAKITFNRGFFTLQFVISLALILSAVVIIRQVQFIKDKPLGFEREIIEITLPKEGKTPDLFTLKTKLEQHSLFKSVSLSSGNPVSGNRQIRFDLNDKEFYSAYFISGDDQLIRTLDLRLIEGKTPSPSTGADKVVNEKFIRHFDIKEPIGALIPGGKGERIIGVVSDFNVSSLKQEIPLFMIAYDEAPSRLLVNYSGTRIEDAKQQLEIYWKEIFPNTPFTCSFLGDLLLSKHKDDVQFSRVIITFSVLSIVISCFGLFALAQNSCQQKGKEIAIRKSLGASSWDVFFMLTREFGKWMILSFILASVVGYLGIRHWIETFAYRANIDWQVFTITLAVGAGFFFSATSFQTLNAANANPVKGLRDE